ncbi:MAG: ATP-binding protein [Oscillospiraceae bacterium]|nr:ATP-binding protein [Oscillospiraceae bacterium]
MQKFIGRENELAALEKACQTDSFQMAVVYGRRRVGKTTLLREFCKDKRAVYYTAIKTTPERNIALFGQCVLRSLAPELTNFTFQSLDDLCSFLGERCREERLVVVIDEFPYMAKKEESLLSVLQKHIDEQWMSGRMFLIVCGSSVSFMEDDVLSEKSPLYGRRTMQLRLEAFDYRRTADFVPSWSARDKAAVYGVTGGIAKYISLFDDQKTLDENIIDLFFKKTGYLYEEAENLLTQEFRDIEGYSRTIEAIASGANQFQEIVDKSHLSSQTVTYVLKNLMEVGILEKQHAITEEHNKKKSRYILKDAMLRFWYRFIPDAVNAIEIDRGDLYYRHAVKPLLSDYMGGIFEQICRQYTLEAGICGAFPCTVTSVGTWWGTNPELREETDIDVVGLDLRKKEAVIGECKFKNEITDKKTYEALQTRSSLLHKHYRVVQYLLFSASSFSDWLVQESRSEALRLIDIDDLYR